MNKPITIAVCFFLSLVLAIGLTWPRYQEFTAAQRKVQIARSELQFREEYLEKLRNVSEQLKKYKEPLSKINSALPDDLLLPTLFDLIESQAAQTGLTLKKINVKETVLAFEEDIPEEVFFEEYMPEEDVLKLQKTKILLNVLGSYDSFKDFIFVMENSARLIKIENISFDSPKEKEDPFAFNIEIKIHSY